MDATCRTEAQMRPRLRFMVVLSVAGLLSMDTSADYQTAQLHRIMQKKLEHSQQILGAVVTSSWSVLDRESRALALAVRDPAWGAALTEPEYLRQSDAFSRALQDLIEASAKRNLEAAGDAHVALTASCVRCHLHMTRRRVAK